MFGKNKKNLRYPEKSSRSVLPLMITIIAIAGIVYLLTPFVEFKDFTFSNSSACFLGVFILILGLSVANFNNMGGGSKSNIPDRIDGFEKTIEALNIDLYKRSILSTDFILNVRYMNSMAKRNLILHDLTNIIVISLSAIVPVLINYSYHKDTTANSPILMLATVFSVILAIVNAFRQSYKFREKWQSYRRTSEMLIIEGQNYFALSGPYKTFATHNDAFSNFINSISLMLVEQVNDYMKVSAPESDEVIQKRAANQVEQTQQKLSEQLDSVKKKFAEQKIADIAKKDDKIAYHEIDHEKKIAHFFTNDKNAQLPDKIKVDNIADGDLSYKVVTTYSPVKTLSTIEAATGIKNAEMPNKEFGSAGCICMQGGNSVIVTCYHVVKHSSHKWDLFIPNNHDNVISIDNVQIGHILEARRDNVLDVAILKINDNQDVSFYLPNNLSLKNPPVAVTTDNIGQFRNVYIISRLRNFKKISGYLDIINSDVTINYGTELVPEKFTLTKLLQIRHISTEPFCLSGDSGSLVFTDDGHPIGIVVAGDETRASFAMAFSTIADSFNLSII